MSKSLSNTKWNIQAHQDSPSDSGLSSEVLRNRGLKEAEIEKFLTPDYQSDLADPMLLPDMNKAIKRIKSAVDKNQKIVIYGDYDIDGITACALLMDFLQSIGANVSIYIPDRFEEGYGLNSSALQEIKDSGNDLVVTVDCGVTSIDESAYAHKIGLDLIITDHHDPPDKIPKECIALINPKLKNSRYPFDQLAGVGVAFSLVRAYMAKYPKSLDTGQEKWLLDLVALGTVCDVVPLVGENRVLSSYGLRVLRKTKRVGLVELARSSGVEISKTDESDLGFRFGPRLNAAGRLEHAKAALNLLISKDAKESVKLADKLNELNQDRQALTQEIYAQADKQAKKQSQNLILVLSDSSWNSGVVGIVASRITEKHHKPAIVIHDDGKIAKGSARSWGGFSIIDAIRSCDDILQKYGGHDFAAGVTLLSENIELFTHKINQYALKNIDIESMLPTIDIDLSFDKISPGLSYVKDLEQLRPYGNSNSQPVFASEFELVELRHIGQHQNHLKFRLKVPASIYDGIAFSSAHKWPDLKIGQSYKFAYYINENVWQNIAKPQLEIIDISTI
ncbi:MAG: single-stranded-DNA-specific exonuclease [Patescibacteria group bacterium]|nr:single-stranded-DNA-specific exonuclease [Patescibacteria group bacterium]